MNHPREWQAGEAFRFGVERAGRFVGLVDIDEIRDGWGELGYWLERAAWGCGYAAEAARAVVRFAFEEAGLSGLRSGHAADNAASGRALLKLGFRAVDRVQVPSRARGEAITQHRYVLAESSYRRG